MKLVVSIAWGVRLSVDPHAPDSAALARARRAILSHRVVAFPTETFYGLAVSVFDAVACARVFDVKGRPSSKALPCIVSDADQLLEVASELPAVAEKLAARFWPGPLTLVVPARASVAARSERGTIAVRVSSLPLARMLAASAGPVTATSANVAGHNPATRADEVERQLGDAVELVLDGGTTPGGLPSTVVDVTSGTPRLVRDGAIPFQKVLES